MLSYFGYLFLLIFIIFMLGMINKGPFIFERGTTHFIQIKDINFDIKELVIKQGDTVEITNYDQFRHSIIVDDPLINNSGLLYEYDTYKHTFNREGIFKFSSSLYSDMDDLIIIVEETKKGKQFYNEIFNNILNFILELINTLFFYIKFTFLRLIK